MNEYLESEFTKIGCRSRKDVAVAVQVYLELCEVKRYWDVQYFYNSALETIYFSARKRKNSDACVFVPIPVSKSTSFAGLQNYLKLCDNSDKESIYVVIVHPDSTCVYYQVRNGLAEPPAATTHKSSEDQSRKLDVNLKRNRKLLEEAALCGIPITIPKKQATNQAGSLNS